MSTARRETGGKRATYADVLAQPPERVAEILDGELFVSPRPAIPQTLVSSTMGADLLFRFQGKPVGGETPGGWWILDEPELHLRDDILVPDLAGWRRERLPKLPQEAFFTQAPDWICEVLSPSTQGVDRVRKMAIYAREKIGQVWLVDPAARLLEVYRLNDGGVWSRVSIFEGAASVRAEPFDAVELDLSRWWLPEE